MDFIAGFSNVDSSPTVIFTTSFPHLDIFISSMFVCPNNSFGKSLSKSLSARALSFQLTGGLNLSFGKSAKTAVYLAIIGDTFTFLASVKSLE